MADTMNRTQTNSYSDSSTTDRNGGGVSDVVSSDRVEGVAVYGREGNRIGSVERLIIEKRSGQVRDAIISVGGFLGIGAESHSIPWKKLDYDTDLGGFKLDVTEEQLKNAPRFKDDERNQETQDYRSSRERDRNNFDHSSFYDRDKDSSGYRDRAMDRDYQTQVYDYWAVTPYW